MTDVSIKVLLVEDSPSDARLIQESLLTSQPAVELASVQTLGQAMEHVKDRPCDVMLLDLSLPDSQGLDTVHRVLQGAPNLPVVVLTGLQDEELGMEAVRLGAQDYMVKGQADGPLLVRALRYAVQRMRVDVQLRQARDELEQRVQERTAELQSTLEALQEEFEARTESQESLQESERKFRQIVETMPDVCWLASADLKVMLYCNSAYERLWRQPREALLRRPQSWMEAVHPDDRQRLHERLQQWLTLANEGKSNAFDDGFRIVRPDGPLDVRARIIAVRDGNGHLRRLCSVAQECPKEPKAG